MPRPRSNFEIRGGGGAPLMTQYWGGTRHFFLLNLYNFQNIGGGGTCPPLLRGPWPRKWSVNDSSRDGTDSV